MNRIDRRFLELRKTGKKAFVAFITCGYPSLSATEKFIVELDRSGADIIELGVPFTDPMADGPVIQEASQAALKKGVCLKDILRMVKRVRGKVSAPLCLMTYYNPVFCFPEDKFVEAASRAGVDGVIIPDLPPEEGEHLIRLSKKSGLDVICFVSPTTTLKRIRFIAARARGFIYYVSLTGVTGARRALPQGLKERLAAIKRITVKPVCVGFGISDRRQVKEVYKISDGAIVGSAIVKKIKENLAKPDLVGRVGAFVRDLKGDGCV
jgi:tryptophan synthase alpha chain